MMMSKPKEPWSTRHDWVMTDTYNDRCVFKDEHPSPVGASSLMATNCTKAVTERASSSQTPQIGWRRRCSTQIFQRFQQKSISHIYEEQYKKMATTKKGTSTTKHCRWHFCLHILSFSSRNLGRLFYPF